MKNEEEFKILEKIALDLFVEEKKNNPIQKSKTFNISSQGLGNFNVTIERINEKKWILKSYIRIV
jgi:hypothetical protein